MLIRGERPCLDVSQSLSRLVLGLSLASRTSAAGIARPDGDGQTAARGGLPAGQGPGSPSGRNAPTLPRPFAGNEQVDSPVNSSLSRRQRKKGASMTLVREVATQASPSTVIPQGHRPKDLTAQTQEAPGAEMDQVTTRTRRSGVDGGRQPRALRGLGAESAGLDDSPWETCAHTSLNPQVHCPVTAFTLRTSLTALLTMTTWGTVRLVAPSRVRHSRPSGCGIKIGGEIRAPNGIQVCP